MLNCNLTSTSEINPQEIRLDCPASPNDVVIVFDNSPTALNDMRFFSEYSRKLLQEIFQKACIWKIIVTSTKRTNYAQARIMYDYVQETGLEYQRGLYSGGSGKAALDIYAANQAGEREDVIRLMEAGLAKLSPMPHVKGDSRLNVIDVSKNRIPSNRWCALVMHGEAYKKMGYLKRYLHPWNSNEQAFHFEIKVP